MLRATTDLIDYLSFDEKDRDSSIVNSFVNSILKLGSKEDAKLLLSAYLKNPFDFDHNYLLKLFRKFGDLSFAEKIYDKVIYNNKLIEEDMPDALEILGCLHYLPIKKILFNYGFSKIKSFYETERAAILGLLHFDCSEYIQEIKDGINNCFNEWSLSEFIPALVCKLPDRNSYLEKLYEFGNHIECNDRNSGIILGFSLSGDEGKQFFKKTIFNPQWGTDAEATGSGFFTYEALKKLNISFTELYSEIKQIVDIEHLDYCLWFLFNLFERRIHDYDDDGIDSFKNLYETFYRWETPNVSNNLTDLAERCDQTEEAYNYKRIFEIKMAEEIIIENCNGLR